jgi:flagellar hook-associated protein 1 FlgK
MTITGSLANALSGLTASARAAELVSSNVANSMTPGYGRREITLAARSIGDGTPAGVNVTGVRREVDMGIVQDRRLADAAVGHDTALAGFHADLEAILGTPDQTGSLSGRLARLEAALIEATARPDNQARLASVLRAAQDVTGKLNTASDAVQTIRMEADAAIGTQVRQLNDGLVRVQGLNYEIKEAVARGQDASALLDLRQQEVDAISGIVPMKQVDRGHGMIALFTTGGAILLDGRAAEIGFSPAGVIVPEMTQAGGALSGLTVNGLAVRTGGGRSPLGGGSLGAAFDLRDSLAPEAQTRLDAVARDLVERFQAPGLDTTRAPGAAGLFTDGGAAFASADEVALSSRISVNALADPDRGGALWRLRDGLGATTPGEVGNSTLLRDLTATLGAERVPVSGGFLGVARSSGGLVADFLSLVGAARLHAEGAQSFSVAQQDSLTEAELSSGVDTDHEMQKLMLIEQAYAANARVITTIDAMLDVLMGI